MQAVKKTDRQRSFLWKFYRYTTSLTEAGRQTDRQRDRKRDRQTKEFSLKILPLYKLPDRGSQTGSQTDRQAGRQAGRQTDRQADRQTDRQTDSFRDLVFDTTSPFPFSMQMRGWNWRGASWIRDARITYCSSRTGQDKIIESLWKSFLFFRKIWKNER